jgi:PAS domain S-box-containing protein
MKTKSLFLIIFLATMGGFVGFVDFYQSHSLSGAQAKITNHARIISHSLRNLEPTGPTGYLSLAASANNYEAVVVRDETGAVFLELTRDPTTALDRFFISLGLMHRQQLKAPIGFEGVPIGRIEATWLQKTTYTYIYILIFLLLLLAEVWLFLKLIEANRTLEDKVRLRTDELEQDITARRQTEREVRRLRNYLSNIIDAMPSILVGVDNDCRVTLWNHSAEAATGVAVGMALGKPLIELLPHLGNETQSIHTAMVENRIRRNAKIPRRLGRELRYEDVTIFPLEAEGEKGAVIRIDDVTERARMEDTLVQSEKMLSVGGLAAGMAHEINNPLAGMMQSISVVQQRLSAELPVNARAAAASGTRLEAVRAYMNARGIPEMLKTIQNEGRRAAAIVQNMLSFARKRDDQWSSQDLGEILDAAVELASTDYDLKKKYDFRLIEIVKEYEVDLPLIPCEKQMIQQVFLNILRNGAEAMQNNAMTRKPRFTLRVRAATRGAERAAQRNTGMGDEAVVCVEIEDNGPGIEEATRRRIFEPFFTTKPVGVGTGLGLSVSYFIITENHKGHLSVEAPPEGGTRFVVCLPVVRKAHRGHSQWPDAGEAVPGSGD